MVFGWFQKKSPEKTLQSIDPICKMLVNENTSMKSEHAGKAYYFCSEACKQQFDKNPAQFKN
ncbi:MAG TPA: YHS domain-containing protein [Nanoarchaeota archaeon]|nr:YHS domain-containing protein [Nanoarchaeota archaeon]